jgi:hypothetical protein
MVVEFKNRNVIHEWWQGNQVFIEVFSWQGRKELIRFTDNLT